MSNPAIAEIVRLMSTIAEHGELHLREFDHDHAQLRALLADTVERISTSFSRVAALASPEDILGSARVRTVIQDADLQERLSSVAQHALEVATELQFHDLASQILARSESRVQGLDLIFSMLQDRIQAVSLQSTEPEQLAEIASIVQWLQESSRELAESLRKAVTQRSVATGEVELF